MMEDFRQGRHGLKPWRNRKPFLPQELRIEHLGLVTRPVIAQDRYDRMTGTEIAGKLDCASNIDPA